VVKEKATFAAGCFWGVEAYFRSVPGVVDAVCGYTGGHTENPTYRDVCTDKTGHAEAVEVTYDPAKVSYAALADAFFRGHDPTTVNRQGPDAGTQYRSAIFCRTPDEARIAREKIAALKAAGVAAVTEVVPAGRFWRAEDYHQRYFEKHPDAAACHVKFGEK